MPGRALAFLAAALVLCGAGATAGAQSSDALVERYTVLAGSRDDARTLVDGLRSSRDFRIGDTAFETPTPELGNGEVNVVLVLLWIAIRLVRRQRQSKQRAAACDISGDQRGSRRH